MSLGETPTQTSPPTDSQKIGAWDWLHRILRPLRAWRLSWKLTSHNERLNLLLGDDRLLTEIAKMILLETLTRIAVEDRVNAVLAASRNELVAKHWTADAPTLEELLRRFEEQHKNPDFIGRTVSKIPDKVVGIINKVVSGRNG